MMSRLTKEGSERAGGEMEWLIQAEMTNGKVSKT